MWVTTVPLDGISRALTVMQLVYNTIPSQTDLISCKRFNSVGIGAGKFPPNLGKIWFLI